MEWIQYFRHTKKEGNKTTTKRAESRRKVAEKVSPATLNYNGRLSLLPTPCLNLVTAWSSISIGPQFAIDLVIDLFDGDIVGKKVREGHFPK
jgi:hypothetical protein